MGIFHKQGLWRHVVTYTTQLHVSGTYGLVLSTRGEEQAKLGISSMSILVKRCAYSLRDFVFKRLERRTGGTVQRRRSFVCPNCGEMLNEARISKRRERGFISIPCDNCNTEVSLLDGTERLSKSATRVEEMEQTADNQRDRESAALILQGKIATQDFDVFLCYNREDKQAVRDIGEQLKYHSILPWLDEWEQRPSLPWQQLLEDQIGRIKAVAVFVGKDGIGPWQRQELDTYLRNFVQRNCPVIPVLLQDAPKKPKLPIFLEGMTWIDFRVKNSDPIQRLLWGITGRQETE